MQITPKSVRPAVGGFALIITMIFLGITLISFASIMYWVSSNVKVTELNNQYNMSSGAAEAAVETVLAQMNRDFMFQSLTTATYYASVPVNQSTWPVQYQFSDPTRASTNGIYILAGAASTNTVPLNSQYAGLYGLQQTFTISAKAKPVNVSGASAFNVPATVTETVQFANIPLFQFAIFYNINLEIAPGQAMSITGPVFSNQGIWAGSSLTTFSSVVAAVKHVDKTANDPFALNYSKTGTSSANYTYPGQPTDNNPSLVMPIGTNNNPAVIQTLFGLPPATFAMGTAAAYSTNGQVYLANAADLYITNSVSGTNSASPAGTNTLVYYNDGGLTLVTPDYYILKNGFSTNYVFTNLTATAGNTNYASNVRFAGYSFITNVLFYDWREGWNGGSGIGGKGKAVQAVQIDIARFNTWMTNSATNGGAYYDIAKLADSGHHIDSVYVYNSVPLTTTTLPAVRVIHGKQLPSPSGFTVATAFPIYVYGDYNSQIDATHSALGLYGTSTATLNTYPAALMADSVTILSDNWDDATTSKRPAPGDTTVNAAMLEGIVQTDPAINGDYSGGVENFMRLLENWGGTLTYNGSIVVMYPSQYATNHWQNTGNYYGAPQRNWSFDQNFKTASKLPPLTPQTKAIIRGQWLAY